MTKYSVFDCNCPMARVTEVLGEPWTLMVLREAFLGTRHFNDFERELGIARNILSARLRKLVDAGLLERRQCPADRRAFEYCLTEAGQALLPVLVGLAQWAGRWLCEGETPTRFVERESGREIPPVTVRDAEGRELGPADVAMVPGPDADPVLQARYERAMADAAAR